jgi:AraC-like DNA-binding protein
MTFPSGPNPDPPIDLPRSASEVPHYWVKGIASTDLVAPEVIDEALTRAGLSRARLASLRGTVPFDSEVLLIESLAALTQDPFVGIKLGLGHNPRHGSIMAYMLFTSPTLGDSLRTLERFIAIVRPHARLVLTQGDDEVSLSIDAHGTRFQTASNYVEFVVAALLKTLRIATGQPTVSKAVRLASPRRSGAADLAALLGLPAHLGADQTQILFEPSAMDLPFLYADDLLLAHLTSYGTLLLSQRRQDPDDLPTRVQLTILRQLSRGTVTRQAAADAMGLSERTLARRLAESGVSFRQLTEQARQQLARAYLADPALAIAEIAFLLGYVDQSSFSVAFRRWTGISPGQFRNGLSSGPSGS